MKTIALLACLTILGWKYMNVAVKPLPPFVRVDTLKLVQFDTVTVIARARDTMRITVREVGPLTEQIVARAVCGNYGLAYGDKRDEFNFNALGMVFCPKTPSEKEKEQGIK